MAAIKINEVIKKLLHLQRYFIWLHLLYTLITTSFAVEECPRGNYNDGGICLKCFPCPQNGYSAWLEPKCVQDFIDCPKLCRMPTKEWTEEAGKEICGHLSPTTTEATTKDGEYTRNSTQSSTEMPSGQHTDRPPDGPQHKSGTGHIDAVTLGVVLVILVIIVVALTTFIYRRCHSNGNETNKMLKLVKNSSKSFTLNVSKEFKDKGYLLVDRDDERIIAKPIKCGNHSFGLTDGIYPNCLYKVQLTNQECPQSLENGSTAKNDTSCEPLTFKTEGVEVSSVPDISSVTLQLDNDLGFSINSIVGCSCIEGGKPIDVTDEKSFIIDNLFPGCKYPIAFRTDIKKGSSKSFIEVGRQQIKTNGTSDECLSCATTATSILDSQDFRDKFTDSILSPRTLHQDGKEHPQEVQELRQRILKQARVCLENSSTVDNGDRFSDNLLQCDREEFVEAIIIELKDDNMQGLSIKSLFIEGVIDESNKNHHPVKLFTDLLLKSHPGCPDCSSAIHKAVHEEPELDKSSKETVSIDESSTSTYGTDNSYQSLIC